MVGSLMATNWTTADLVALDKAIALGALRVQYTDFTAEYRSLDEMLRLRDLMRGELGLTATNSGGQVIYAGRIT
jgi:hypothetical protein